MKSEEARDDMIVSGPQGTGTLKRNINGWDVYLLSGEVRQHVDLAQYSIKEPQLNKKMPSPFDAGKKVD